MHLSIIYARSENGCIGNQGRLPWQLPDEFASFLRVTDGHAIIMGRKTYEDHQSYFGNRLNIVLTRQPNYAVAAGVVCTDTLTSALALGEAYSDTVFIIGGADLISGNIAKADSIYETVIHGEFEGDTYLPIFDFSEHVSQLLERHETDSTHSYPFSIYKHSKPTA